MNASRSLVSRLLSQQVRKYQTDKHFKPPTMDELPIPAGSWQAQHARNQTKYNMVLAFGIGFLAFSMIVAKTTGLVYLNYSPPKSLD